MLERECNAFVVDDIANICHLKIFVVEALARNVRSVSRRL